MKIADKIDALAPRSWQEVSKRRAFLRHLALSACIVGSVFIVVFLIWYPRPYFTAVGAWSIVRILVGVDLVLGPLLTLVVFRPGKRLLILDMFVIGIIQCSALIYGVNVLYQERPYYTVFAIDRFQILAYKDIPEDQRDMHDWMRKPMIGPLLAIANLPDTIEAQQQLMEETVFGGAPDIERRPNLWTPYESGSDVIIERARPLDELRSAGPTEAAKVAKIVESLDLAESELGFFPLSSAKNEATAIVDLKTGHIIAVTDIDPWQLH